MTAGVKEGGQLLKGQYPENRILLKQSANGLS